MCAQRTYRRAAGEKRKAQVNANMGFLQKITHHVNPAAGCQKASPKPSATSQNGVPNQSEIDLMLRTLKSDFAQTLPHFCSFLRFRALQKSSRNRLQDSIPVTSSTKCYKTRHFSHFRSSWLPNWLQHRSPKPTQNRPKTCKNRLEIPTSLQDAPKMAPSLKNVQK